MRRIKQRSANSPIRKQELNEDQYKTLFQRLDHKKRNSMKYYRFMKGSLHFQVQKKYS